jgi:hypothetical protein
MARNDDLVPVGSTRDIEFVADAPGDWPLHCHMTHHEMNQMGHGVPNMLGVKPGAIDKRVQPLLPAYMTMGQDGMGEMGEMGMPVPEEQHPDGRRPGPHGYISMGGMFTMLKVRDRLVSYADPGFSTRARPRSWPRSLVASRPRTRWHQDLKNKEQTMKTPY